MKRNVGHGSPTEFDKLLRFIVTFQGRFALAFICGDDRRQRQDVLASLGNLLREQGIELRQIDLTHRAVADLLSAFKKECSQDRAASIVVTGIEASLKSPLFASLNVQRDLISREINCPLLFWVSNFALREMAREAPDLYDFRYTVFDFKSPEDREPLMRAPDIVRSYFALSDQVQSSAEWTAYLGEQLDRYQRDESSLGYREKLAYGELLEEIARGYKDKQYRTEALIYLEKALKIYRELQEHGRAAAVLKAIADTYFFAGDQGQAVENLEKALPLFREIGDRRGEAQILSGLGAVQWAQGTLGEAETLYHRALALFREIGDRRGEAMALLGLGAVQWAQGTLGEAETLYHRALALFREIGDRRGEAMALESLGDVQLARDAPEEAVNLMTTASDIYSSIGDTYNQKLTLLSLVEIYLSLGDLVRARSAARQAKELLTPVPQKLQRWESLLQELS